MCILPVHTRNVFSFIVRVDCVTSSFNFWAFQFISFLPLLPIQITIRIWLKLSNKQIQIRRKKIEMLRPRCNTNEQKSCYKIKTGRLVSQDASEQLSEWKWTKHNYFIASSVWKLGQKDETMWRVDFGNRR